MSRRKTKAPESDTRLKVANREQVIADHLLAISDRLSEALANADGPHGEVATVDDLLAVNGMVWALRWELGLFGGQTELTAEAAAEAAE